MKYSYIFVIPINAGGLRYFGPMYLFGTAQKIS